MDQIAIGLQGGPDTSGVVHAARKELGAIFFGVAGALVAGLIVMGFVSIGLMSSVAVPPVGIVLAAGFLAGALAGAIFL